MKCSQCGKELVTGDIHWEMGICNHCYNSVFSDVFINGKTIVYPNVVNISVDDFGEYKKALHRIAVLERALKIALEMTACEYCPRDVAEKCDSWLGLGDGENCSETLKKYCIDQAEKELEEKK